VNNKYVVWISVIFWVLSLVAVVATQGNEIANAVVLILSFWMMYIYWSWNIKQSGRL